MRGAFLPLHSFLVEVLEYFNLAPFQFTPNFFYTMVAFYIAYMEVELGEPSTGSLPTFTASKLLPETRVSGIQASRVQMWRVSGEFTIIWAATTISTFSIHQSALVNLDLPVSNGLPSIPIIIIFIIFDRFELIVLFYCRSTPLPKA